MNAREIYDGSDGEATKRFYAQLGTAGPMGSIAINLFRAQKCSARAKLYRGGIPGKGRYKQLAYERKSWSMGLLCVVLAEHARHHNIKWGWKPDPAVPFGDEASHVLYVDLPDIGQVSFHSPTRGEGPQYPGEWDRTHVSADRIIRFCDSVLNSHLKQLAL